MAFPLPARRIGFVLDSPDPSGVGEHLCTLAPRLAQRGYAVHLVCRAADDLDTFRQRWAGLGLSLSTVSSPCAETPADFDHLVAHLRTLKLDIAHIQLGISWEIGRTPQAAAEAGIAVRISTEHLPYLLDKPDEIEMHRVACDALNRVITVSDGVKRSFIAQGLPAPLLRTIHNGIDLARFSQMPTRLEARRRLKLPPDAPIVLHIARFTEQKGHSLLVEAAERVGQRRPEVQFLLVGDGPLWQETHRAVAQAGLRRQMRFIRRHQDVRVLMAAADLLVLPSRFEGHPLVALEAMAAGLPVLGTDVCGTAETVEHGLSGWLAPAEDADAMAEALSYLLGDAEARCRLARAAQRRVASLFSADRMADDVDRLYREQLDRHVPYLAGPTVQTPVRLKETA